MSVTIVGEICAAAGWRFDAARGEVEVPIDAERKQVVRVEPTTIDELVYLRLISTIGPAEALDRQRTQAALRLNAELRHGAFAIVADELAVVDLVAVAPGCEVPLRASLAYVARTADRYEQVVFKTDAH